MEDSCVNIYVLGLIKWGEIVSHVITIYVMR